MDEVGAFENSLNSLKGFLIQFETCPPLSAFGKREEVVLRP